jgi:hypothetical protein
VLDGSHEIVRTSTWSTGRNPAGDGCFIYFDLCFACRPPTRFPRDCCKTAALVDLKRLKTSGHSLTFHSSKIQVSKWRHGSYTIMLSWTNANSRAIENHELRAVQQVQVSRKDHLDGIFHCIVDSSWENRQRWRCQTRALR